MNEHTPNNQRTQDGKSPVGPGKTQVRGFKGMPRPGEVTPQAAPEQPKVQSKPLPGQEVGVPVQTKTPAQSQVKSSLVGSTAADYAKKISEAPEQVVEKKARPVVRTFKNDATTYIKQENITDTQIALAEQKRNQARNSEELSKPKTSKKLWVIVPTALFVIIGIAAFAIVYLKPDLSFLGISQAPQVPVPQVQLNSLTGSTHTEYLSLDTNLSYAEIDIFFDKLLRKENSSYLFVEETFDGRKEFIFPNTFFQYTRMYGLQDIAFAFKNIEYGAQKGSPYLLFEASDFPKVYPQIFAWEEQMVRQIEPLFPELRQREVVSTVIVETPVEQASSGSEEDDLESGSQEEQPVKQEKVITETIDYRGLPFADALYENQSIRVLLGENEQPLLYYTFMYDRYVLIAQDLEIIPEMIEALR